MEAVVRYVGEERYICEYYIQMDIFAITLRLGWRPQLRGDEWCFIFRPMRMTKNTTHNNLSVYCLPTIQSSWQLIPDHGLFPPDGFQESHAYLHMHLRSHPDNCMRTSTRLLDTPILSNGYPIVLSYNARNITLHNR